MNSFQSAPIDLFEPEFWERRRLLCIDPLAAPETLKIRIGRTIKEKAGISNALVDWRVCMSDAFLKCIDTASNGVLQSLLGVIAQDLCQMRSGFPDLTVINPNGDIEFIEVKGPNDQVQRNQAIWIRELNRADIPTRVLHYSLT